MLMKKNIDTRRRSALERIQALLDNTNHIPKRLKEVDPTDEKFVRILAGYRKELETHVATLKERLHIKD